MSETKRIRWEDKNGEALGYPGRFTRPAFRIWPPDDKGDRVLLAYLAGDHYDVYHDDTENGETVLKAKAERLLEEFVSSLGAVFPAGPVISRCECGGLASHRHGCRWRQGYGSLIEAVTDGHGDGPAPETPAKEATR